MASKAKSAADVIKTNSNITSTTSSTKGSVTITDPHLNGQGQYVVEKVLTQPSTTPV